MRRTQRFGAVGLAAWTILVLAAAVPPAAAAFHGGSRAEVAQSGADGSD